MPEAGAFSHYQNLTFTVNKELPAGHEIFVSYGDSWFEERREEFGEDVPLSKDFQQADLILQEWSRLMVGDLDRPLAQDLYQLIVEGSGPILNPAVRSLLPKLPQEAVKFVNRSTAYRTVPNAIRSLEWLEKHGMCLDNIHPSDSTVTLGTGAFATRFLPKNSIVAPAPLIHFSREHLEMVWEDQNKEVLWQGHQLLLNYCFGHPSSSLLFFPYSPAVNLINHNHTHPNVAI